MDWMNTCRPRSETPNASGPAAGAGEPRHREEDAGLRRAHERLLHQPSATLLPRGIGHCLWLASSGVAASVLGPAPRDPTQRFSDPDAQTLDPEQRRALQ